MVDINEDVSRIRIRTARASTAVIVSCIGRYFVHELRSRVTIDSGTEFSNPTSKICRGLVPASCRLSAHLPPLGLALFRHIRLTVVL